MKPRNCVLGVPRSELEAWLADVLIEVENGEGNTPYSETIAKAILDVMGVSCAPIAGQAGKQSLPPVQAWLQELERLDRLNDMA